MSPAFERVSYLVVDGGIEITSHDQWAADPRPAGRTSAIGARPQETLKAGALVLSLTPAEAFTLRPGGYEIAARAAISVFADPCAPAHGVESRQ